MESDQKHVLVSGQMLCKPQTEQKISLTTSLDLIVPGFLHLTSVMRFFFSPFQAAALTTHDRFKQTLKHNAVRRKKEKTKLERKKKMIPDFLEERTDPI